MPVNVAESVAVPFWQTLILGASCAVIPHGFAQAGSVLAKIVTSISSVTLQTPSSIVFLGMDSTKKRMKISDLRDELNQKVAQREWKNILSYLKEIYSYVYFD